VRDVVQDKKRKIDDAMTDAHDKNPQRLKRRSARKVQRHDAQKEKD